MASICLGLNELTPLLECLLFGCSSSNNCGGCNAVFYKRRNGRPVPRCNSRYSSWWHHERKCCQHYWPFVMGIPGSLVITITKGEWSVALKFSLLKGGIICWTNRCVAGDYHTVILHGPFLSIDTQVFSRRLRSLSCDLSGCFQKSILHHQLYISKQKPRVWRTTNLP